LIMMPSPSRPPGRFRWEWVYLPLLLGAVRWLYLTATPRPGLWQDWLNWIDFDEAGGLRYSQLVIVGLILLAAAWICRLRQR